MKLFKKLKKLLFWKYKDKDNKQEISLRKRFYRLCNETCTSDEDLLDDMTYKKVGILYIEPKQQRSSKPVIDEITKKMTWLWRHQEESGIMYFGTHGCICGAESSSNDHLLPLKNSKYMLTNSLCVHYVAYHREEIPSE